MMIHIEPLGTECVLPAFMVGYELPLLKEPDILPDLPRWIVTMDQQAGGSAMSYPSVVGAVLRLESNQEKGKQPLAHLIRGLKYMAEDPNKKVLSSDYPVLRRLVCSLGNEYPDADLRDLESFMSSYLLMPPIQNGIEAFIRCMPCDPMKYFASWKLLDCSIREDVCGSSSSQTYRKEDCNCYFVDDSNLSDLNLSDETEFDEVTIATLAHLAETCGATTANPNVFLLWENSD